MLDLELADGYPTAKTIMGPTSHLYAMLPPVFCPFLFFFLDECTVVFKMDISLCRMCKCMQCQHKCVQNTGVSLQNKCVQHWHETGLRVCRTK